MGRAGHRRLRVAASLLLGIGWLACGVATARAQQASIESAVKATYLYKFVPYVQWPPAAFASPASPVVVCVLGGAPFADLVSRAVGGERLENRPLMSRRLTSVDANSGCHVLFAAGTPTQSAAEALAAVRGKPVLTVTDAPPAAAAKGIVNFVLVDNRVRFEINLAAAAENGLAISSKLLSLAVAVKQGS